MRSFALMGRRLLSWWEALPDRGRVAWGIPVALLVLFAFHEAFFPLLTWQRSLMYAVMEAVPVSLVVAFATKNELRRRADRRDRPE